MNKKIKQIAVASYTNGKLDPKKVTVIANTLTRKELKAYIKELKNIERKKRVTVVSPSPLEPAEKKIIAEKFSGKQIEYKEDLSLMAGVKIIDNDIIYDLNLKNILEDLASHISRNV